MRTHDSYYLRAIAVGVMTLATVLPLSVGAAALIVIGVETDRNGRTGLDLTLTGLVGVLLGVIAAGLLLTGLAAGYSNFMKASRLHAAARNAPAERR